jgi:hypothetical protein
VWATERRGRARDGVWYLLLLLLAIHLQWKGGAYGSELGGSADEAAHFVTGLMIHDYLAAGAPASPMAYARDYYDHYPKIALGNWPPVFYVMQGLWSLVFSPSRVSILVLMAALSTLLAALVYRVLRDELGVAYGVLGSALLMTIPMVQQHGAMVMTEIPIALWTFSSIVCWGRFLRSGRPVHAAGFGLFAAVTILTKGSGVALALVPPLTILLSRRLDLLRRPAFWTPVPVVLLIAGPWTWAFREVSSAAWGYPVAAWPFVRESALYYPKELVLAVGVPLFALAVYGAWLFIGRGGRRPTLWHAAAASVISVVAFQVAIPCGLEARHLLPALPSLVLLVVAGVRGVQSLLERAGLPSGRARVGAGLLAVLPFGLLTFGVPQKRARGFEPIARRLLSEPGARTQAFLVASDPPGEGQFVSEVALLERRPGHFVRRASKVLASADWNGRSYRPKYRTTRELLAYLERDSVGAVVIDGSVADRWKTYHHRLLDQAVREAPGSFSLLETRDAVRGPVTHRNAIRVYRVLVRTTPAPR